MVDHYEPGTGGADEKTEQERVTELLREFPKLNDLKDSNGRVPQRTWFFPPHYHRNGSLARVVSLCADGYGEIELHLHHGKHQPDTHQNLRDTLERCIEEYSQYGIFGSVDGERRYAFVHGDSALDNSRGGQFCGVNNEIDILLETGCYADFTHPSGPISGPRVANKLFYATGRDHKAKSYNSGSRAKAGRRGKGLLIFQGPLHPYYSVSGFHGGLNTLYGLRTLGDHVPDAATTGKRIHAWVDARVNVKGRDDVIFVKTSTHGANYPNSALGEDTRAILKTLRESAHVHYVTAREAFNTVRAIEDEVFDEQDPIATKDYEVKPPSYNTEWREREASPQLQALIANTYRG